MTMVDLALLFDDGLLVDGPGDEGGAEEGTRARGLGRGRGRVDMIAVLEKMEPWESRVGALKSFHVIVTVTLQSDVKDSQ